MAFQKGNIAWNKGMKGVCFNTGKTHFKKREHPSPKTEFKKGDTSPRKGKKYPQYSRENSSAWKGGKLNCKGYIYILQPTHPRANKRGYIKRAYLIIEKSLNRYIKSHEIVHHINEIKDDDRIENLKLFPSRSKHTSFHLYKRHDVAK